MRIDAEKLQAIFLRGCSAGGAWLGGMAEKPPFLRLALRRPEHH
jgi:hypothetical protein